ncbi:PspC domain-containing protein [Streptomyces himalayensis]|uniref:PspC domain-containing protein n=1 Tax=Streptomyces himalayensis subsp. himalayensis TaxID=2756131 RepID=A0A7W0DGB7_9ACTN|nr:PspC domain-containing protein [Streptomyces himalayensis]MBA2944564.1 PspC domain-containing protein [Streptomyces himalayensis subsp. himalayensis]
MTSRQSQPGWSSRSGPKNRPQQSHILESRQNREDVRGFRRRNAFWRARHGRIISGTLAGIARRLAVPAWGLRVAYVFITVWFMTLRWQLLFVFVVVYAALAVALPEVPKAKEFEDPSPAARPNLAAAGKPLGRADADLKAFVHFLWEPMLTPMPLLRRQCHGFVCSELRFDFRPRMKSDIHYSTRMPFGRLLVYPDWLVFLTDWRTPPQRVPPAVGQGAGLPWLYYLRDYWRWIIGMSIIGELVVRCVRQERDRYRQAFTCPNSIVLPLGRVTGVRTKRTKRWLTQQVIILQTGEGEVMLAPSILGLGLSYPRMLRSWFGANWDPKLLHVLQEAAAWNAGRKSGSPQVRPQDPRNASHER